jgi:hypothetical protein
MTPAAQHVLVTVMLLALIAWRLYARVRRNIGRQRLSRVRPWITVVVFPLIITLLAFAARGQPTNLAYLAVGLALGVGLGLFGLRLTRFEVTSEGLFYTPSAHIGIALSLMVIGRVVYRYSLNGLPGSSPGAPPSTLTPLTLLLVGMLGGYYCVYAIGLLRWSLRNRAPAPQQVPS